MSVPQTPPSLSYPAFTSIYHPSPNQANLHPTDCRMGLWQTHDNRRETPKAPARSGKDTAGARPGADKAGEAGAAAHTRHQE